jgi:hypothetical protein
MFLSRVKITFLVLYAAYALFSLLIYSRAANIQFCRDDHVFLSRVETLPLREGLKPSPRFAFYRPGALGLFYLEHRLFERKSGAYIVFNCVLHFLISVLMLAILLRLRLGTDTALLASGIFLLGFGHFGKQMMWACSSGSLVSVLLSLAAILAGIEWMRPAARDGRRDTALNRILYPAAIVALLTVSPLFHETSIVTGIVIASIIMVMPPPNEAHKLKRAIVALLPLALWVLVFSSRSEVYLAHVHIRRAALGVPLHMIRYTGFMTFPLQPTHLAALGSTWVELIRAANALHIAVGSMLLATFLWLAFKAGPGLRVLSMWFVCALLPFTLVQVPGTWLELRYLYCASIPFCGFTAAAVVALAARGPVLRTISAALLIGVTAESTIMVLLLESAYSR